LIVIASTTNHRHEAGQEAQVAHPQYNRGGITELNVLVVLPKLTSSLTTNGPGKGNGKRETTTTTKITGHNVLCRNFNCGLCRLPRLLLLWRDQGEDTRSCWEQEREARVSYSPGPEAASVQVIALAFYFHGSNVGSGHERARQISRSATLTR
jgi:hypothetical protein